MLGTTMMKERVWCGGEVGVEQYLHCGKRLTRDVMVVTGRELSFTVQQAVAQWGHGVVYSSLELMQMMQIQPKTCCLATALPWFWSMTEANGASSGLDLLGGPLCYMKLLRSMCGSVVLMQWDSVLISMACVLCFIKKESQDMFSRARYGEV